MIALAESFLVPSIYIFSEDFSRFEVTSYRSNFGFCLVIALPLETTENNHRSEHQVVACTVQDARWVLCFCIDLSHLKNRFNLQGEKSKSEQGEMDMTV